MDMLMVDTGDVRLACRIAGDPDGSPVVLLHGRGSGGASWDPVLPQLARRGRRLVIPDLRGHGRSSWPGCYSFELMRDDLGALLDGLDLDRVDLIGHSMGGTVAYLYAAKYPERVARLVLEEPPPPYPWAVPPPHRPDGELDFDWAVVAALRDQLTHPAEDWRTALDAITAPTLVLGGGLRSHLPQDHIATMAHRIPGGRLVTIPGGHDIHTARPLDFAAMVDGFLG